MVAISAPAWKDLHGRDGARRLNRFVSSRAGRQAAARLLRTRVGPLPPFTDMAQALAHINLLGIPRRILPGTSGGPYEGELGDALETTPSRWADECHAMGGTVIGAHMTSPNSELA